MKALITVADVKACAEKNEKRIYTEEKSIITPAARDIASDLNIEIIVGDKPKTKPEKLELNGDLVASIVEEVIKRLGKCEKNSFTKEVDASGLRLVKGDTVVAEEGETEVINSQESAEMTSGLIKMTPGFAKKKLEFNEVNYVIKGKVSITIDGNTYFGKAGDVIYLPKNVEISISSQGDAEIFYVRHPR
ncbi:ethanolamine utilization protein EutQ [Desulfitispora alkaliphila]|uniref:cupin domain-containing protein n=1 Tax=Desulfitispora alkaliphila TaxID=622674 RepID=UPI003D200D34